MVCFWLMVSLLGLLMTFLGHISLVVTFFQSYPDKFPLLLPPFYVGTAIIFVPGLSVCPINLHYRNAPYSSMGKWTIFGLDFISAAAAILIYLMVGHTRYEWYSMACLIGLTIYLHGLTQLMHAAYDIYASDVLLGTGMQLLVYLAARFHDHHYASLMAVLFLCFAFISRKCWLYVAPPLPSTEDVCRFDLNEALIVPTIYP